MRKSRFILLLALLSLAICFSGKASGPGGEIIPDDYPALSDDEMAQLRWILDIADQPLEDFSNMDALDQEGMTSYRYCLAFMTYFMALEQYHKLPAAPGIIQPRMDRFIQKMIQKPVWEFWAETSKGLPTLEPKMDRPYPEDRDPVHKRNIMYSGHVGHMIGLYETLYRDMKWEQPGSITFEWDPDERYVYDYHMLNRVMNDQMRHNPAHCVECEPNACFPECNQHPIMSFMLYDSLHGSTTFEAAGYFMDFFLEKEMIDPRSHETAMLYLVKQDLTLSTKNPHYKNALDLVITPAVSLGFVGLDSASADGWTGTFMHVWQPEYIERHYEYQKKYSLRDVEADKARLAMTVWEPQLKYGFFAMLAAEVGDLETRDKLIKFADEKYRPLREGPYLYYPFNLSRGCTALTGKLLACARAMEKDSMRKMHVSPFSDEHFRGPALDDVDFPRVVLRRALYDAEKKALILTAEPGEKSIGETSFAAVRLDPAKTYLLSVDGAPDREITGVDSANITVPLSGRINVILAEK